MLYDPAVDSAIASSSNSSSHANGPVYPPYKSASYYRALIEHVRKYTPPDGEGKDKDAEPRIKGKGKGKETLVRFEGEVVGNVEEREGEEGSGSGVREEEIVVRDPRLDKSVRRPNVLRPPRQEFLEVRYEVSGDASFFLVEIDGLDRIGFGVSKGFFVGLGEFAYFLLLNLCSLSFYVEFGRSSWLEWMEWNACCRCHSNASSYSVYSILIDI